MRRLLRFLILTAACAACAVGTTEAQTLVEPPFGLRWGDSPEKLIAWAARHSLDLTITLPGDQPKLRVLKIAPRKGLLPESKAAAVEARFLGGRLYELTVHYADPEASADLMGSRFEELRRQVARQYGPLLPNRQERTVADQYVTRRESFHREPVKGLLLLLAMTEVEDLLRKTTEARFSLVYRNDNLRAELEAAAKAP